MTLAKLARMQPREIAGRTADAYRTAIRVLQHALGLAPDTDVVDLDVEEALSRLRARTAGRYTHHSIETYCGNIHRIIGLFTDQAIRWAHRRYFAYLQ